MSICLVECFVELGQHDVDWSLVDVDVVKLFEDVRVGPQVVSGLPKVFLCLGQIAGILKHSGDVFLVFPSFFFSEVFLEMSVRTTRDRQTYLDVKHEVHGWFDDGCFKVDIRMLFLKVFGLRFKVRD
jgi:hypothetical protein